MSGKDVRLKKGDSVDSIAHKFGLFPDTIWLHPKNADLKALRKYRTVLLENDLLFVPVKDTKTVQVASDKKHSFKRLGVPAKFNLQLLKSHEPLTKADWKLVIPGFPDKVGKTDTNGYFSTYVPPNITKAKLYYDNPVTCQNLLFGELSPIDTILGQQQRLCNLGYLSGSPSGNNCESMSTAVMAFQIEQGLESTGIADESLIKLLEKIHDTTE
jgi:N-acetylmuramoyl-L-alanine amidase